MSNEVDYVEEEEVIYEELPQPHIIDTGDSVKVKQVLDDTVIEAITSKAGYEANYSWDNFKLFLMFLACVFALVAQFYPMPFPASRPLLAVCCAFYFIISGVLQLIVSFVDKDTILFTKAKKDFPHELQIRTSFPRFQEYFTLIVQFKKDSSPCTTAKMYVGKYFTSKGEFEEEVFVSDVVSHVEAFVKQRYEEIEYNHKTD
eukprot:gene8775-9677_t